jgi:hypothetical protein
MGEGHEARRLLPQAPAPAQSAVFAALGDRDAAFTQLHRSIAAREDWLPFIKADPDFDSLRTDPRWTAVLERMRLVN